MPGFREEVLNIALARTLSRRGLISIPETIRRIPAGRRLPDILVFFRGLRVVLEGKCGDYPDAENAVFGDVRQKVDEGIGHIGIAVVYPAELRGVDFDNLEQVLDQSILRFRIYSESGERPWMQGSVDLLASVLTQIYQEMVREDVVTWGAETLAGAVERLSSAFLALPAGGMLVLQALEMERLEEGGEEGEVDAGNGSGEA